MASPSGPSPQRSGLPPAADVPQGWAEGRAGIHPRLLLGSLGPSPRPGRAATVASGGLCTPILLGGSGDGKGPKGTVHPSPPPTRSLQGCLWKFLEPKILVGSPHSQATPEGLCLLCRPQVPPQGARWGRVSAETTSSRCHPANPALSCCTTAGGPFQNQPPPRYGEAPDLGPGWARGPHLPLPSKPLPRPALGLRRGAGSPAPGALGGRRWTAHGGSSRRPLPPSARTSPGKQTPSLASHGDSEGFCPSRLHPPGPHRVPETGGLRGPQRTAS